MIKVKAEITLTDDEGNTRMITLHPEDGPYALVVDGYVFSAHVVHLKKEYRDKDWLSNAYTVEGRSMADIAAEQGVTPMAIRDWLVKHEIPTRPRGRRHTE